MRYPAPKKRTTLRMTPTTLKHTTMLDAEAALALQYATRWFTQASSDSASSDSLEVPAGAVIRYALALLMERLAVSAASPYSLFKDLERLVQRREPPKEALERITKTLGTSPLPASFLDLLEGTTQAERDAHMRACRLAVLDVTGGEL